MDLNPDYFVNIYNRDSVRYWNDDLLFRFFCNIIWFIILIVWSSIAFFRNLLRITGAVFEVFCTIRLSYQVLHANSISLKIAHQLSPIYCTIPKKRKFSLSNISPKSNSSHPKPPYISWSIYSIPFAFVPSNPKNTYASYSNSSTYQ